MAALKISWRVTSSARGGGCRAARPQGRSLAWQRPDYPAPDRWTATILLFHDHEWEAPILIHALFGEGFFIGAQGGRCDLGEERFSAHRAW